VLAFWELLRSQGFIDYPSITYLTFLLLDRFPDIAKTVSARYREVLIDEMQDTDSLQVELLRRLADAGRSRFFMVGDPMQSIFGFAGAEPARMFELAEHLDARTDFELLENWRSSSRIVRFADALCPRDEAMRAVGPDRDYRAAPVIVSPASAVDAVVGGFLPMLVREGIDVARAAVLAPAWYLLVPIAQELRRLDVPVSGPGSRPYHRRGRLMTGLLENLCACMGSTRPDLLRRVQYEIFDVCQCAEGEARFEAWGRAGRLAALQMIFRGRELRQSHVSAIPWIEAAASAFAEILRTHGFVGARGVERIVEAGAAITADIRTNRNIDPERLVVDDLGMFANPDGSMKLLTFHAAKGREFDAVCVVELQEGQMPHPSGNIEESRRVLYVAVTRPHRVLMLSHRRNARRCRFLDEPNVLSAMA
jgi:DNA helicase-2/ATP-dependent DNA helicase PcrA